MRKPIFISGIILIVMIALISIIIKVNKGVKVNDNKHLTVSIPPLKYLINQITGDDFIIDILLPNGVSPENYEPTPRQLIELDNSSLLFTIGLLDFEKELSGKLSDNTDITVVELKQGVETVRGNCTHTYHEHAGGADPHIWSSPRLLKKMAKTAYKSISLLYPDSVKYYKNYLALDHALTGLDMQIEQLLQTANVKCFVIYHPALTYYSVDYDIEQMSIENEGKEPSVEQMKVLVNKVKAEGITKIFVQKEFSRTTVETLAHDINAEIVEIDPLAENVADNLLEITKLIVSGCDRSND